mgnify:FL=1
MQLTKEETEKINIDTMEALNDWNDNPKGWLLTHSKADRGAGVYFVGTVAQAGAECDRLDAMHDQIPTVGKWYVADIPEDVKPCPLCKVLCHVSLLEGLGSCLSCDIV